MAQRQFRSDDTDKWKYGFGDGSDGSTYSAPANAGCSGTSGSTSLSIDTASSFANGDLVLIHQSRGTGAGNWELNKIASGGGTTSLTLAHNLCNTYTDSGASQAQIIEMKQYNGLTLGNTTAPDWDQNKGGIIAFFCKGELTISGTLTLSGSSGTSFHNNNAQGAVSGRGYRNGLADGNDPSSSSTTGEGTVGDRVTHQDSANGNGGSAGINGGAGAGGGNGAVGGSSQGFGGGKAGGTTSGNAELTSMTFGGGGGGGHWPNAAGSGGTGAGMAFIFGEGITITGSINLNGGAGGNGNNSADGAAGGGGAGGSCLLKGSTIDIGTNKITATGGSGGTGGSSGGRHGGAGAVGRIHADYKTSFSGSTSPTIDTRQDSTIAPIPKGAYFHMSV